jgi:hypothetical protein
VELFKVLGGDWKADTSAAAQQTKWLH